MKNFTQFCNWKFEKWNQKKHPREKTMQKSKRLVKHNLHKNESDARKIYFKWLSCLLLACCLLLKQHKKINILKHRIAVDKKKIEENKIINRKKYFLCVVDKLRVVNGRETEQASKQAFHLNASNSGTKL